MESVHINRIELELRSNSCLFSFALHEEQETLFAIQLVYVCETHQHTRFSHYSRMWAIVTMYRCSTSLFNLMIIGTLKHKYLFCIMCYSDCPLFLFLSSRDLRTIANCNNIILCDDLQLQNTFSICSNFQDFLLNIIICHFSLSNLEILSLWLNLKFYWNKTTVKLFMKKSKRSHRIWILLEWFHV